MTDFDLAAAAGILTGLLEDVEQHVEKHEYETFHLPSALTIRDLLNEASTVLKAVRERYDDIIGEQMGQYRVVVDGHGQIERHRRITRRNWDSKELLRIVMDSRLVTEDGEIQSPIENLIAVYPTAGYNARLGELKKRNIDPDEFCETEVLPGWKLEVK